MGGPQDHQFVTEWAAGEVFIGRIGRIRPIFFPPTPLDPRCCQPLAVAASLNKLPLQTGNLPIKQIIGLVNQTDHGVSHHCRIGVVEPFGVEF